MVGIKHFGGRWYMIITINKDNSSLSINVNTLQVVDMLSRQTDYLDEKAKSSIHIYYNIYYNCLYIATPIALGRYMGWNNDECDNIKKWVNSFIDYGPDNCLRTYLNWLTGNFNAYTILYGQRDIIGCTNKPSHLIVDARFNCTASICIGIYDKTIAVVGLQQQITMDLQNALQTCKYIRICNGKLAVVV